MKVFDVIGGYFKTIWGHLTSCDDEMVILYHRHLHGHLGPFWVGWTFGDLGLGLARAVGSWYSQ